MIDRFVVTLLLMLLSERAIAWDDTHAIEDTFSIIARDTAAGELGMAVQSKAHAVGSRTISAKGGLGVIAHQAQSNPMYGQVGLDLLARGMAPQQALDFMLRGDEGRENRQVAILDMQGRSAAWTGKNPRDWKGHRCTPDYCVQGNILAGPEVLDGMVAAFEAAKGQPLAERLIAALDGGQAAGGDRRGMQAAALVIVKPLGGAAGFSDRAVDVRVDDHGAPIPELRRIFNVLRSNQILTEAMNQFRNNQPAQALRTALAARDLSPANDNVWVALAELYMAPRLAPRPERKTWMAGTSGRFTPVHSPRRRAYFYALLDGLWPGHDAVNVVGKCSSTTAS
jgi:uncharacterized Ntn-hydrolase superfamily protein